jgi:hypothetical protein
LQFKSGYEFSAVGRRLSKASVHVVLEPIKLFEKLILVIGVFQKSFLKTLWLPSAFLKKRRPSFGDFSFG